MSFLFPRPRKTEERVLSTSSIWGTVDPVTAFLNGSDVQPANESLLRLSPVYAATRLIADQIAALPCSAYTEANGINVKMPSQPQLIEDPSLYGTRYDWTHRMMTSLLLRGNAVGLRGSEYRGWPGKVEWLDPSLVTCQETMPGKPLYYNGSPLIEGEFVHIPAYVLPGVRWGLTPVGSYRSVIAAGLAAQDFAADWFTSGAPVPKGILRNTEQPVVAEAAKAVKESYKKNMSHGDVFVTGKDWEWTSVQMPADDIRFIEMLRASATQIASIYGVPPEMIGGETASSLTYSTVEQNMLNFSTLTLRPWVTRIEAVLTSLLPRGQYVKFNLDAVVRSDTKTKYDVFKIQSDMKHRTPNELRALDDLAPLPGGDKFPKPPAAPAPEPIEPPEPEDDLEQTRHLPGKHDQSSHGGGGGGSGEGDEDLIDEENFRPRDVQRAIFILEDAGYEEGELAPTGIGNADHGTLKKIVKMANDVLRAQRPSSMSEVHKAQKAAEIVGDSEVNRITKGKGLSGASAKELAALAKAAGLRHLPGKHDQSSHGGGGGSQGSGTADDPIRTSDVDVAANAIIAGKYVQLKSKDEVSSVLGELKRRLDSAKTADGKAPDINLCHISVPKTNLFCAGNVGRARVQMPQLKGNNPVDGSPASQMPRNTKGEVDLGPGFVTHMRSQGITVSNTRLDASHLKASQSELDAEKTLGIAQAMRDKTAPEEAIFVTRDNYIIDGHHRWAATVSNEYIEGQTLTMPVRVLNVDIVTALKMADDYTGTMGMPTASMNRRSVVLTLLPTYKGVQNG
jgi:HK97 family phage portal protein